MQLDRLGYLQLSQIILTPTHHQRSPAHHIVSCTTLLLHITHGLHFPSTIALITHLSPITHCTDYTAGSDHTLYKSLGLLLSHCWVLFRHIQSVWALCLVYISRLLPGLFIRLLPAFLTLSAFWYPLSYPLSAACPDLSTAPVVNLPCLLYTCYCYRTLPVWPPLVFMNKAALGSQCHWPPLITTVYVQVIQISHSETFLA